MKMHVVNAVAKPIIKGQHSIIVLADAEADLWTPQFNQKGLGLPHKLNKEGYLTVRGKQFRGAHVHSILKKRLAKEELLNREHAPVWSDFSMEVVYKTILMSDFGFKK